MNLIQNSEMMTPDQQAAFQASRVDILRTKYDVPWRQRFDVLGISALCFGAYACFLYYMAPTINPSAQGRVAAQLSYHWGGFWVGIQQQLHAYLPPFLYDLTFGEFCQRMIKAVFE